jgi:MscS family membrane protein
MGSAIHVRPTLRAASLLAVALLLALMLAHDARSEAPEPATAAPTAAAEKLTEEDLAKPMGPPDPYNRGTPRGAVYGFVAACRSGDYERAAEYLDLRQLPPEEQNRGPELARKLRAALGPVLAVDYAELSDRNEGASDDGLPAWQDRLGAIETSKGLVTILLQRVPRKDGVRVWKISADTVARTDALYEEFGPTWLETWLPPVFFQVRFLHLDLSQWLGLVALAILGWLVSLVLAGSTIRVLARILTLRGRAQDERIVRVMRGPVRLILTVLAFSVGRRYLALDLRVQDLLGSLERLLWIVGSAWLVFRLIDMAVLGIRVHSERHGNAGLLPVLIPLQRLTKVMVVAIGFLAVLGAVGVNITAALAGLGVGGVAVALAAQKSLENLFGGVSLFADRPVRVGDFFRYGDQVGTVEEIGLRSTRVRTLDRTVVTIPNAEFSNLQLENFAQRDRMRLWTTVGVRYETTPDQLRFLLARLRQILLAHPRVTEDPARVRLVGFGTCSLDLEVFAYVDTADWSEFLAIREDLYLRFIDAINEAGTGFAFPSSTTYLGRDAGLNGEKARRAEETVAAWREKGELPFPDFADQVRLAAGGLDDGWLGLRAPGRCALPQRAVQAPAITRAPSTSAMVAERCPVARSITMVQARPFWVPWSTSAASSSSCEAMGLVRWPSSEESRCAAKSTL